MAEVAKSSPDARGAGAAGHKMGSQNSDSMLLSMDDFKQFKQIGKGKDCVVYSAMCDKLRGASVVLKVYDKAKISAIKHRSVRREARIMRYLTEKGVPHTTAYTGAFQDSKQIYIVMEHCAGGDLLEQLLREGRAMAEKRVVREVVLPTLTALAFLHAAGIIHRDVKLENLFISSSGHLQLGDFGLAISTQEERAISPVGTLEYMPPEILRLPSTDAVIKGLVNVDDIIPVDEKVDIWSFGVTVYELVTGRSPFEGANKDEIRAAILGYKMRQLPHFLTPGCQDFILQCMCPRPSDRPGAVQLLNHPWVLLHCTPSDLVAVAKLPLQLPRVPMGYKASVAAAAAAAGAATASPASQQQQQAIVSSAAAGDSSTESSSSSALPAVAAAPAAAVAGGQQGLVSTKLQQKTSAPGTPSSPQIPAFIPGMPGSTTSGGSSTSSGTGSSHGHGMSAASVGGLGSSGSSGGSSSSSSAHATSVADSAASFYHGGISSSSAGFDQSLTNSSGSNVGARHGHVAAGASNRSVQEPIFESPADELAAARSAASVPEQQQQQYGAEVVQHNSQQHEQGRGCPVSPKSKRSAGGSKLFKWMCMTSVPLSENTSQ